MKKFFRPSLFSFIIALFLASSLPGQDVSGPKAPSIVKDKDDFHIYLLIGGSNMLGKTTFSKPDQHNDSRVFVLNSKDEWVSSEEIQKFPDRNADVENCGPGLAFGRAIVSRSGNGVSIGLINCAVDNSSIKSWLKGQDLYQKAVQKTKLAMKTGTIKGILWNQGEADALSMDLKTYNDSLSKMIEDLRTDLAPEQKIHPLPFSGSKLATFPYDKEKDKYKNFNENMEKIFLDIQRRGLVDTKGLNTKGESTIFDNDSLIEIGRRYAAMMTYLYGLN